MCLLYVGHLLCLLPSTKYSSLGCLAPNNVPLSVCDGDRAVNSHVGDGRLPYFVEQWFPCCLLTGLGIHLFENGESASVGDTMSVVLGNYKITLSE